MKRILCYGDSNTWGCDPVTNNRLDEETRWPRVLGQIIGPDYEVIEEGLSGRTTVWDDPTEGYKNGREYLIPCLESHRPLDLVIILLGTNDLKKRFNLSALDIAQGAGMLVRVAQESQSGRGGIGPQVLLLAPPPLAALAEYAEMFEGAGSKSLMFSEQYLRIAQGLRCAYLDTSLVIVSSPLDGFILKEESTVSLEKR